MMSEEQHLLSDRYLLEEQLGAGGMAVVYRAQDTLLERTVAIKLLRRAFSRDTAFRERFRQEAKAAANLSHPNIITVYDFGFDSEYLYIVMEYLPGTDLKTIIKQRSPLPISEGVQLMVMACAGIGYAHRAGLVHCDIKPHNILVTPDLRLKVTDFGIARALASISPDEKTDYVWGSPQYFAPEQAAGEAPSPASDVYSLGVIMYEMFTGRLPFEDESPEVLTQLHREALPITPREFNTEIPPVLEQIILKVLSKEPSARYRTADQLGRVLISSNQTPSPVAEVTVAPQIEAAEVFVEPEPEARIPSEETPPSGYDLLEIDWIAVLLGLIALIAVGGLVPFWIWVYFIYNPPAP